LVDGAEEEVRREPSRSRLADALPTHDQRQIDHEEEKNKKSEREERERERSRERERESELVEARAALGPSRELGWKKERKKGQKMN